MFFLNQPRCSLYPYRFDQTGKLAKPAGRVQSDIKCMTVRPRLTLSARATGETIGLCLHLKHKHESIAISPAQIRPNPVLFQNFKIAYSNQINQHVDITFLLEELPVLLHYQLAVARCRTSPGNPHSSMCVTDMSKTLGRRDASYLGFPLASQ